MNVLVIGSGAREQAIVNAFKRSPQNPQIFCYAVTNNPGIFPQTAGYEIGDICDAAAIVQSAKKWHIELAVIGPEAPLEKAVADALWANGIPTIGPKAALAQIETSKAFARDLMQKYQIPGLPRYRVFTSMDGVENFLESLGPTHYVIKANGLMGGKGVKIAGEHLATFAEAIVFCESILKKAQSFVIEEKLLGQEFSLMCFCDGKTTRPMPVVQDHKRAFVNDMGPNTGGMGSYSDANHSLPFLESSELQVAHSINEAIVQALATEFGQAYIGILYGSYIVTARGVFVIEFNARFGDPEALNVLPILESDFLAVCQAMTTQSLAQIPIHFAPQATVCKYTVPQGYPDSPLKNILIDISQIINPEQLFFASVDMQNEQLLACGSRTAACVGIADNLIAAEAIAENDVANIRGALYHREDIGTAQLIEKRVKAMQALRSMSCA